MFRSGDAGDLPDIVDQLVHGLGRCGLHCAIRSNLPLTVCRSRPAEIATSCAPPRSAGAVPRRASRKRAGRPAPCSPTLDGIAGNYARLLQPLQPVLHRGARQTSLRASAATGSRESASQEREQLFILGRDLCHAAKWGFCRRNDDLAVTFQHFAVCFPSAHRRYVPHSHSIHFRRRSHGPARPELVPAPFYSDARLWRMSLQPEEAVFCFRHGAEGSA